jgi:hypothetical protein
MTTPLRLLPDLEVALRQLPGIKAASVVTGPDATPTEVHVLATTDKTPKQVVRDVQSLAMARYDLDIDHRIVSVVQFDDPNDVAASSTATTPEDTSRPVMSSLTLRTTGTEAEATITLSVAGSTFEGSATGVWNPAGRPRLVARAALSALSELLGGTAEVTEVAIVPLGARQLAVCVLSLVLPRQGEHVMTGSALVRGDEADAVARCVLDAVNRRIAS